MQDNKIKNIVIIGSTGSIGTQTIEVALCNKDRLKIIGIAAFYESRAFTDQVNELQPEYYAAADVNPEGALKLASLPEADIVVVACNGFAGLKYSLEAVKAGKTLALANKETLVCAGNLLTYEARKSGSKILPIDSEHSAIWQCLGFDTNKPFRRLIITASGGPFKGFTKAQLKAVTPEMALSHPVWNMGAKITVDSATMLNKGFEVIEAHHLFGAGYDQITAVLHPQSIVHSMVEFDDGAVLAQLSQPDMRLPIQVALCYPDRPVFDNYLDFEQRLSLEFSPVNEGDYPCFDLALKCGITGGSAPTFLNAASEIATGLFIDKKLPFTDIYSVISDVLNAVPYTSLLSYEDACAADNLGRQLALTAAQKYMR